MKLRTGDPWMSGVDYSATLNGFGVNLLVMNVDRAVHFARAVLCAETVYSDPDFAVLRYGGQEWMLHADHTYDEHPHVVRLKAGPVRGLGIELRIHGRDVDEAVEAAVGLGCEVLSPPTDKRHGMREAYVLDFDGYTWVVDQFIGAPAE